jgi:hypothetical protein
MVSALGDEHTPTTAVVTTELESYTDSVSVSALEPAVRRQLGSSGPETVLAVCYYVAIMTVIITNYYSFSARLRTPIVWQCPRLTP